MPYEKAVAIANAKSTNLRFLAKVAGGNPSTFFRAADLGGLDLSGQDLRGFDLTGANLTGVSIDQGTKVDVAFVDAVGNAARDALIVRLENQDRRVRGHTYCRIVGVEQLLSREDRAASALDELLSSDALLPLRFDHFTPSGFSEQVLTHLSDRYLADNGQMSAFDRTLRTLMVKSDAWSNWAVETALGYARRGTDDPAFRRPLHAVTASIASVASKQQAKEYVDLWRRRHGMRRDAGPIVVKWLPQVASESVFAWAEEWYADYRQGIAGDALAAVLTLLAYIPGPQVPARFEPRRGEEFDTAMLSLQAASAILDSHPPGHVAEGLLAIVSGVDDAFAFSTRATAGAVGALSDAQKEELRAVCRQVLMSFGKNGRKARTSKRRGQ